MASPSITVNVSGAIPTAGTPTDTGVLFFAFTGATGPTTPTRVTSMSQALAASVPTDTAAWLGDFFANGGAAAFVVKVAAATPAAPTVAECTAALDLFTDDLGPGQVVVAGIATAFAYTALLAHANAHPTRVVLLDVPTSASFTAADSATTAAGLASAAGSTRAAMVGPRLLFPALTGSGTREVPASVIAAGLAARSDAEHGSAGFNPSSATGARPVSVLTGAVGISTPSGKVTKAEADTLYGAGINPIRISADGKIIWLQGWIALSADALWHQLQHGRLAAEVGAKVAAIMAAYSGQNIDGQGRLFAQVAGDLGGYLLGLYAANVLYGAKPADAYTVVVDFTNNTPATIAAGELHGAVAFTPASSVEQITINAVVRSI